MSEKPALQQFETFLMVAEQKSFTKAADKLGISKAAVSHAVRLLEQSLEVPLFIRSTRNVMLTDEGKLLQQQCKRLQIELETARDLIQNFKAKPTGTLRISCNPFLLEARYFTVIEQYQKKFPKVALEIFVEERTLDMQQEQIDCVIGVNWSAPDLQQRLPINIFQSIAKSISKSKCLPAQINHISRKKT